MSIHRRGRVASSRFGRWPSGPRSCSHQPRPSGPRRSAWSARPEQVVTVSKGASALLVNPTAIQRFSIGDPTVAEAVVVSPTEVLINGKTLGTTSLFLWDNSGNIKLYSIEVTADAAGLQRYLKSVLEGEQVDVTASGNVVTLSGQVRDASVANRAVEIARAPARSSWTT